MTNKQVLEKMSKDIQMRNFSRYTYYSYIHKGKEIIDFFSKPIEKVTIEELRYFLFDYLINERKLSDRSVNYYNSIIRFMYEVTMDKLINKKQIPMRKNKKTVYKVLTKEELSAFFNCVDNYKFKTIFMLAYGSGLRIGEIVNLHISDIDSKQMRIFIREGKGNKERYTILSKTSLEMLRIYWKNYRKPVKSDKIFLTELDAPMTVGVIRDRFRRYRKKAGLNEKVTMHTLRHCYATNLIENGATLIQVKELMGHSNIRSTMAYIHVANIDLGLESPLDIFMKGEENGENKRDIK